MVIINMLYKKIVHVMLLCKEKPLTRHLERSETKSKDLNYCLFTSNSISERNPNKLFLCIYDTFTYSCKQE